MKPSGRSTKGLVLSGEFLEMREQLGIGKEGEGRSKEKEQEAAV